METALSTVRPELTLPLNPVAVPDARPWPRARHRAYWPLACVSVDSAMLVLAAIASEVGSLASGTGPAYSGGWTAAFLALTLSVFAARGLYRPPLRLRVLDQLRTVASSTSLAAMAVLTFSVLTGDGVVADLARPWAFALVYVSAGRVALSWSQARARQVGETYRPTLIVGAGRVGVLTAKRLLASPTLGLRPVAFLDKEPLVDTEREVGIPVAGASWDFEEVAARYGVEHVVVTFSRAPDEVLLGIVRRCEKAGIAVSVVPRLFENVSERLSIEHLGGLPLVSAYRPDPKGWQFAVKYAGDRLFAAVLVLLTLPVLLAAALAVRLSMGRPIFFRQRRVGRDGRTFEMLKFRSMTVDEPATVELPNGSAPGGVEGEDRRTGVGGFLRRTSIDELPQLLNVLWGEMSIVGPRPERPEYASEFEQSVYRYGDRHRVKSGITGWAQVHGLYGKTSIDDRAEWDNFYIENFSLWLDVKILVMTVGALLTRFRGAE